MGRGVLTSNNLHFFEEHERQRVCVCVCTRVNAYMYVCMWLVLTANNSHFLEEVEVSVGVGVPIGLAQSGSRVEEVDSQVRVFPFHRLADVLSTVRQTINLHHSKSNSLHRVTSG